MTIDTAKLMQMLFEKYKEPEYLTLTEIPNTTGYKSRAADAMAFSLWPSRGLTITGFEVKASRSDWIKERDNPAKAEALAQYCDFWYLVVANENIVHNGELPATWGLMAPKGEKLKVVREAASLHPENISRKFLMATLRRAFEYGQDSINIDKKLKEAYQNGYVKGKNENSDRRYQELIAELENTIKNFQDKSGMTLTPWNAGRIGEIVHLLDKYGTAGFANKIKAARESLNYLSERMDSLLSEMNGTKES